jgi:hypothetical protein
MNPEDKGKKGYQISFNMQEGIVNIPYETYGQDMKYEILQEN